VTIPGATSPRQLPPGRGDLAAQIATDIADYRATSQRGTPHESLSPGPTRIATENSTKEAQAAGDSKLIGVLERAATRELAVALGHARKASNERNRVPPLQAGTQLDPPR
jgi:hypothetical protein